ncbi:hypothetical protein [Chryseobacterium gambrini]|uniref:hypothetical protein n=1 Tax=Chryseobacterium gambrini TaxID=373672 RepID=UPI003D0E2E51
MLIKKIANQIPDKVRSEVLLTEKDIIENASPTTANANMQTLLKIWHTFVEPHKEVVQCPVCLSGIITNFKQLKPYLIELENDYQKLKSL